MHKYIAICTDITAFNQNKVLNKAYAAQFPGAGWMPVFAEIMQDSGYKVITGDVALEYISNGTCKPQDIMVIQELDAIHGEELIKTGAVPALLTGFESPLFAYNFYDKLTELAKIYKKRLLFAGAFADIKNISGKNFNAHFPTYSQENLSEIIPWKARKEVVLVASNKYCHNNPPFTTRTKRWRKWFKTLISKNWNLSEKNQLQTKRLDLIAYFGKLKKLDLFGRDWQHTNILPLYWQLKVANTIKSINPQMCDDKVKTIAGYKFAICLENIVYPGYITEKIIDCFVAGVIPMYLGAPDIEKFVPENTFIDLRKFKSYNELNTYLNKLPEADALGMINAGRDFLNSEAGKLYEFKNFANHIKEITLNTQS